MGCAAGGWDGRLEVVLDGPFGFSEARAGDFAIEGDRGDLVLGTLPDEGSDLVEAVVGGGLDGEVVDDEIELPFDACEAGGVGVGEGEEGHGVLLRWVRGADLVQYQTRGWWRFAVARDLVWGLGWG